MINSLGSNVAALKAFGTKMRVTSNNIANVNSIEFKKSRALLKEGPNGNVEADVERIDTPGQLVLTVEDGQVTEKELSNVDLSEEIPQMMVTQHGYEANLKAIKTQDEMVGSAIDILG